MWLEEKLGTRVNMERTAEAIDTGADVVSTACPYCMIMLDDAVRANAKEDDVRVLDLSQLLEESMGDPVAVGGGGSAEPAGSSDGDEAPAAQ
jgi:Fe-S oxidoreductase